MEQKVKNQIYIISDRYMEIGHKDSKIMFQTYIDMNIEYFNTMIKQYREMPEFYLETDENRTRNTIEKLLEIKKKLNFYNDYTIFSKIEHVLYEWCWLEYGNINFKVLNTDNNNSFIKVE
jgi:hypothetical protein